MTDFMPESSWIETASTGGDFWESTRPSPDLGAGRRAHRRPAAALATDVHELLDSMARKRVPRLDRVRQRLHESRTTLPLAEVDEALQALHVATAALDFMAGRSAGEGTAEFLQQGRGLAGELERLGAVLSDFLQREAIVAPVSRLLWMDLVQESGSLRRRVRRAAHWLAEMDMDLVRRRKGANTELTLRAIDELARRAAGMHQRLQGVHRLCGQARAVHAESERLAAERAALWSTLQDRVLPACRGLDQALQPLLHAASYRALVPTELVGAIDARHALQVELTQAAALILRLDAGTLELATQLQAMADRAGRLTH